MFAELGCYALILALCFTLIQWCAPLMGHYTKNPIYFTLSSKTILGQFVSLSIAFLCLIISFLINDMTVIYVREHSHPLLPLLYRVGAAWGGHEGSLLLWCLILAGWSLAFDLSSRLNKLTRAHVIMILGLISCGFITFLLLTSNPFKRNFPTELITGNDLTPLLQDPGLIFHPPMLYLGYVGFAIAFAFAVAALLEGKLNQEWAAKLRPWVILPWAFLGCGIVLGSWWAYRELGWGGWWFWDPVENASLLPWLTGTALLHSLIVSEKRGVFYGWTILLAIICFALSLVGTFLVRSGVLISVHAFASDPTRGIFLLSYLTLIVGGALLLYLYRIKAFYKPPAFQLLSRETLLLINSIILLTVMFTILLGTLYPIILDSLNQDKISVGEPYFNTVFLPIILPLLILMGFAPFVNWQHQTMDTLWKKCRMNLIISIIMGTLLPYFFGFPIYFITAIGLSIGIWIILSTLFSLLSRRISLQQIAMVIAHLGIAVVVLGITINKSYSENRQLKLFPGDTTTLAGYEFTFNHIKESSTTNYQSLIATFLIQKAAHHEMMTTEQRIYKSHDQTLSRPGVTYNAFRDLYLTMGTIFPDGGLSIRIYYKPGVRWIWAGGFMLLLGGLITLLQYKRKGHHEIN